MNFIGDEVDISSPAASAAFPSLTIMADGSQVTTYKVAADIQSGNGEVYLRKRVNDSASWGDASLLFGNGGVHNYDEAEIIPMPDGTAWAISSKVATHGLVYKVSTDNFNTWGTEQAFPDVITGGYAYALGNHYVRVGNRIIQPIYAWADGSSDSNDIKAGVLITDDSGANWTFSFLDPLGWSGLASSEAGIAWLGGTELLGIGRAIIGGQNTYRFRSHDLGDTWDAPTNIGTAAGGPFPWLADIELTWFGTSLVLSAITNRGGDVSQGLSAWVTTNGGTTWSIQQELIPEATGEIGYHGIEYISNNQAYMVFNSGGTSTSAVIKGRHIQLAN